MQEQFKNYTDQKKQIREDIQQKIQELIANVSKFISDEEEVLKDTSLTRRQEREQVSYLLVTWFNEIYKAFKSQLSI